jgi:hypothetical protein
MFIPSLFEALCIHVFVWVSGQAAIVFLYNFNRLGFIRKQILCLLGTKSVVIYNWYLLSVQVLVLTCSNKIHIMRFIAFNCITRHAVSAKIYVASCCYVITCWLVTIYIMLGGNIIFVFII